MKKVLIVDDEEDMLWMLQRNLDSTIPNIETFAAQSGDEALDILRENEINLVITDINMPGISGLDLLTEVSTIWPDTKVIIMTAYPSNAFENKARKEGAMQFVEKPFDIKEMRKIVEAALQTKNHSDSPTGDGIDLVDIIQFNGLAKTTSALKIKKGNEEGMIYFREGMVVYAQFDEANDEEAFFQIIEIKGAELQNIEGEEPPNISMEKTVESLMLAAAVLKDEKEHAGGATIISEELSSDNTTDQEFTSTLADTVPETLPNETANSQPIEDIDMTEIQKILAEFTNIDGVHTACLVGRDGFLLDSLARSGIDAEMIGAIASSGFGSAETMGNQLGQGELSMTMLEYNEGPVMFAPVGDEAFLVIVADKDTNLGWIRIAIKKNSAKIEQVASL